jgi:ABC-2 type transport system permease protein
MKLPERRAFQVLTEMNVRQFARDRLAAFFTFLFPLLFALVLGLSLRSSGSLGSIGLMTLTHGPGQAQFSNALRAQSTIRVVDVPASASNRTILDQDLKGIVVIEADDAGPAGFRVNVVAATDQASSVLTVVKAARDDVASHGPAAAEPFNYSTSSPSGAVPTRFEFIMPGLIAMALLQLGLFATATPLINDRARGTLRHLTDTPMSTSTLLSAQVVFRFAMALAQITVLMVVATRFGLHVQGRILPFAVTAAFGTVMFVSIGYALAGVAPSRESGLSIVLLANFAMLFLGPVFFNLHASGWLRMTARALPITYLADGLRQALLGVPGSIPFGWNIVIMVGWTVLAVGVALKTFQFELKS